MYYNYILMETILLHTCCAPCSSAIIEWMLNNNIRPVVFYYSPNIYPLEEYNIRKDECTRYVTKLGLDIIEGDYNHEQFWEKNWKKGGLSERRRELLIENNFYNQQYCGCEFSMRRKD